MGTVSSSKGNNLLFKKMKNNFFSGTIRSFICQANGEQDVVLYFKYQAVSVVTRKKLINAGPFSSIEHSVPNWMFL